MTMKYIVRSLIAAGALAAAGAANADFLDDLSPIIGVDYYHAWMKGKNNFSSVVPKSYPGATFYLGTKFHECFGVELGFDWSAKKSKNFTFAVPATSTVGATTITGKNTVRRSQIHLDLIGYLPIVDDCFELFGTIGYGWFKPKFHEEFTQRLNVASSTQAAGTVIRSGTFSRSKGKSIFRLGVGAMYMVTDCIGLRAKLGWETTSSVRYTGINGTHFKPFKDTGTLAVGAFVKF